MSIPSYWPQNTDDQKALIGLLADIGEGKKDIREVWQYPKGELECLASCEIDRLFNSCSEGSRWHPDDDEEELLGEVCAILFDEYVELWTLGEVCAILFDEYVELWTLK